MVRKPRLSLRNLMIWIGVIAALLALGRYPFTFIQAQRRFFARSQEGGALILDLLAHAQTMAGPAYLSNRRADIKQTLHGYGRPSPDLTGYAVGRVGTRPGESTISTLAKGVRANDWRLRVTGCRALGQYGIGLGSQEVADASVAELIGALHNDDPLVREIAIESFHEIGPKATKARDALIQKLRLDPNERVRWQAARTLPQVEKEPKLVVPALITAIGNDNLAVRIMAISSLGKIGSGPRRTVPALIELLSDENPRTRQTALQSLGRFGPEARAAASLIEAIRGGPSDKQTDYVMAAAADALRKINPED